MSAQGKLVSANYFAALGVEPMLGRGFNPEGQSVVRIPLGRCVKGFHSVLGVGVSC